MKHRLYYLPEKLFLALAVVALGLEILASHGVYMGFSPLPHDIVFWWIVGLTPLYALAFVQLARRWIFDQHDIGKSAIYIFSGAFIAMLGFAILQFT